jgi:response regulator RpfG family c-di-GMP phosphodiesterase
MKTIYTITTIMSFLQIIFYCGFFRKKEIWFVLTFVFIFICNAGYLAIAMSTNLSEALLGNRISYMGSVFLPFFLFFTVLRICKMKYFRALPFLLVIINCAILALTMSGGVGTEYYKNVSFELHGSTGVLVKEYGKYHSMYFVYLISYFIALVGVIVRSFFKRKVVSYKIATSLAVMVFINILVYFLEQIVYFPFEVLTISYLLTEFFLLFICRLLQNYDTDIIMQSNFEQDATGVILFDAVGRFKGCNDDAESVFTDLEDLKLDAFIPPSLSILVNHLIPLLNENGTTTYQKGEKIYRLTSKAIYRNSRKKDKIMGTSILITDDTSEQQYVQLMNKYNERLKNEVKEKTAHLRKMHDSLILSMADMVEGRDPNTGGHIKRTSKEVAIFVKKLESIHYKDKPDSFYQNVAKAAPMHDLGKIAIDDAILRKPGKFSPEEFEIMKTHAQKGADIVGKVLKEEDNPDFYQIAVNVAHYHHERYDGTGYPEGRREKNIPFEARIMALADVFDALVTKRCYKEEYSYEESFQIIQDNLGKQFDPELGLLFLSCKDELIRYYETVQRNE